MTPRLSVDASGLAPPPPERQLKLRAEATLRSSEFAPLASRSSPFAAHDLAILDAPDVTEELNVANGDVKTLAPIDGDPLRMLW